MIWTLEKNEQPKKIFDSQQPQHRPRKSSSQGICTAMIGIVILARNGNSLLEPAVEFALNIIVQFIDILNLYITFKEEKQILKEMSL